MSRRLIHMSLTLLMLVQPVFSLAGMAISSGAANTVIEHSLGDDALAITVHTLEARDEMISGSCHDMESPSKAASNDCCDNMHIVECLSDCSTVTYAPITIRNADTDLPHFVVQLPISNNYLSRDLSSPFRPPRLS